MKDTVEDFYANIDRLTKLIQIALEKKQVKNAEVYVNYFFEVLINYYQKQSDSQQSDKNSLFTNINVSSDPSAETDSISQTIYLPRRDIGQHFNDDFICGKVRQMLLENIATDNFGFFQFLHYKILDSIKYLLKSSNTHHYASLYIGLFKFSLDKVHSKRDTFSSYELSWYYRQSYKWFVDIYRTAVRSADEIFLVENEILHVLRFYFDHKLLTQFEWFLENLSTSSFLVDLNRDKTYDVLRENIVDGKSQNISMIYHALVSQYDFPLCSPNLFKSLLATLPEKINATLVRYNCEAKNIDKIKDSFIAVLLNIFKEKYLKVILVRAISYSFITNSTNYFKIYREYVMPQDADAKWLVKNYTITSASEIVELISNFNDFTFEYSIFNVGFHGFEVYINTFLGFYINKFKTEDLISRFNTELKEDKLIISRDRLIKIKNENRLIHFKLITDDNEFKLIINKLTDHIDRLLSQMERKKVSEVVITEKFKNEFTEAFLESYKENSVVRPILDLFKQIKYSLNPSSEKNPFGISQLFPKSVFVNPASRQYISFSRAFGKFFSEREDARFIFEIQKLAAVFYLNQNQLQKHIVEQKDEFDIIICRGIYDVKADFPDLHFSEYWTLDNKFKNLNGYVGVLDNHYNVFVMSEEADPCYYLISSKGSKVIEQLMPPNIGANPSMEIFNYSIIDLDLLSKESAEYKKIKEAGNNTSDTIWFRIYEEFQLIENPKFNIQRLVIRDPRVPEI